MRQYFLQLTTGTAPGPFDVYLSGSSGETLYTSSVTKVQLQAGISIDLPDNVPSSSVVVYNNAYGCANEVQVVFPTPPVSLTPTPSITPSITPTITPTLSILPSITPTLSITPSITISISPSPTITPTRTTTPSPTITPSQTTTPSITPSVTPVCDCYQYEITNYYTTAVTVNYTACDGTPGSVSATGNGLQTYINCAVQDSLNTLANVCSGEVTDCVTWVAAGVPCGNRCSAITPTPTPTPSITPTSTISPTTGISTTPTLTPSETPTITPTITPSRTPTHSPTLTPSITPTVSTTQTPSITPTPSETPTQSIPATISATPSETPTQSVQATISITPTISLSITPTLTPTLTPTSTPIPGTYYCMGYDANTECCPAIDDYAFSCTYCDEC